MKKPILVVMAAGMGSRYGGLKQIDPVGCEGEAILDYSLFDAHEAGFDGMQLGDAGEIWMNAPPMLEQAR